jgi:hypothetical protein
MSVRSTWAQVDENSAWVALILPSAQDRFWLLLLGFSKWWAKK